MCIPIPPVPPGGSALSWGALPPDISPHVGFSDGAIKRAIATCGYALYASDAQPLAQVGRKLSVQTRDSNVPELHGLLALLEEATSRGVRHLIALMDSFQVVEALAKQREGRGCRYPEVARVFQLLSCFDYLEVRNIANRHNKEADALCAAARC